MFLLNITNFNVSTKWSELQASLNYLLSLTTVLGLTDFSFGVWEKSVSKLYSLYALFSSQLTFQETSNVNTNFTSKT